MEPLYTNKHALGNVFSRENQMENGNNYLSKSGKPAVEEKA